MVYNFNLGIGWASSGVEYAQSYRANLLRRAHIPARFVFTDNVSNRKYRAHDKKYRLFG